MSYTSGDVMDMAAACLNDNQKLLFSYTAQLPYLRMAQRDVEHELLLHDVSINLVVTTKIPVLAGESELVLPPNFFLPIKLWERTKDSTTENWQLMGEQKLVEDKETVVLSNRLLIWDYKHNCINFNPATTNREVKIDYWRTMPPIVNQNSTELINGGLNALGFRTAELCARYIGGAVGKVRADDLALDFGAAIDRLASLYVKNNQGTRVRRKPFRVRKSNSQNSSVIG